MNQHYYKVRIVNLKLILNFHRTCQPNPFELISSNNKSKIKHQHNGIWISIAPASQAEKPPGNLFPEVLPTCTWRFNVDKTRKANVDKVQCWEGLLLINQLWTSFQLIFPLCVWQICKIYKICKYAKPHLVCTSQLGHLVNLHVLPSSHLDEQLLN